MELALSILGISSAIIVGSVLYFAYRIILLLEKERVIQHQQIAPQTQGTSFFIPQESPDAINPLEDEGLPLDQFTPSFKKPLAVAFEDDRDEYTEST